MREPRKITTGRPDEDLPDNNIKTNNYTCLNFVPKNLYLQFSKLANVYFLVGITNTRAHTIENIELGWLSLIDGTHIATNIIQKYD